MLINIPHCPGQPSCPVTKSNSAPLGKSAKTENFSLKTCSIRDLGTCVFRTLKELMGGARSGGIKPAGPSPPLSPLMSPAGASCISG